MPILQTLVLSLFIHLTLVWLSQFLPPPEKLEKGFVQFEILESPPTAPMDDRKIVRQAITPEKYKAKDSDDPLRFWSEETQRVKKQMQAALKGLTQNRSLEQSKNSKKNRAESETRSTDAKDFDPFAEAPRNAAQTPPEFERGVSTFGNAEDDLEIGAVTALNTDRYLYYSFYSRVEVLFRSRWEPYVRRAQRMLPDAAFANTANEKWTTVLEIWLKSNGEFHSTHLLKSSGIRVFDEAATRAFVEAQMFPNPPKDKIDDDGLVKLKYQLTVLHNPTLTARIRE